MTATITNDVDNTVSFDITIGDNECDLVSKIRVTTNAGETFDMDPAGPTYEFQYGNCTVYNSLDVALILKDGIPDPGNLVQSITAEPANPGEAICSNPKYLV